jgi:hypothetical protein
VNGSSNTDYITMYYNDRTDGSVPGEQEPGKVFSTGNKFAAVWHLSDPTGLEILDSTNNKNNSEINYATTDTSGYIGFSQSFNGTAGSYIQIPDSPSIRGVGGVMVSAWVQHDRGEYSSSENIVSKKTNGSAGSGYELLTSSLNEIFQFKNNGSSMTTVTMSGGTDYIDTAWHHFVAYESAGTATMYFDGVPKSWSGTPNAVTAGTDLLLFGATSGNKTLPFQGSMDEVRIEAGASRTNLDEWVKLCYENQRLDQTLVKPGWFHPNWNYRIKITVPTYKINGTVNDFPLYVDLSILNSTNFFSTIRSDGRDIMVVSEANEQLPTELVWVNTSMQTGELYFKAPYLDSNHSTSFYIYYGNSGAWVPNMSAVWSNGYAAVWHLNGDANDSTSNANNGTPYNGSFTTGEVGQGYSFNGLTSYIDVPSSASLSIAGPLTMSVWFSVPLITLGTRPVISKLSPSSAGYGLTVSPLTSSLYIRSKPGADSSGMGSAVMIASSFQFAAATLDNLNSCEVYYNGGAVTTDYSMDQPGIDGTNLQLGQYTDGTLGNFSGTLDEVRISNVRRTGIWISNEYNNIYGAAAFYNRGPVEPKF